MRSIYELAISCSAAFWALVTSNGQKVWECIWGGANEQVGAAIGVHDDGSIYVMVSDFNYRGPEESDCYDSTTLVKLDSSGSLLWNKSIQTSTIRSSPNGALA